jgi:hypothetical protein
MPSGAHFPWIDMLNSSKIFALLSVAAAAATVGLSAASAQPGAVRRLFTVDGQAVVRQTSVE